MPSPFRPLPLALCGVLMLATFRATLAAPTSPPLSEAAEDRLLETSITRAKEQLALENPAAALAILTEAYARVPTPALLWPIAELRLRLAQPKEGLAAIDKYVAQVPPSKMPKGQQLADVEKLRDAMQKQVGRLILLPLEPSTRVRIDDEELDTAAQSQPIALNPGRHRLESQLGGKSRVREVSMNAGQELRLDLRLAGLADDLNAPTMIRQQRPVRTAAMVLGGIGLAGVIVGGVLWGLDGLQSCPQAPMCHTALDSQTTGVGLLGAGLGLGGAALILGLIDDRNHRADAAR